MAVDLSSLDPRLADAVRRGRRTLPGRVRPDTDSESWPAEAQAVVRRAFRDGSFRAAIDEIEASSPDLALE